MGMCQTHATIKFEMVVNSFIDLYNIYNYILFNVLFVVVFERFYKNFIVN